MSSDRKKGFDKINTNFGLYHIFSFYNIKLKKVHLNLGNPVVSYIAVFGIL